MVGCAVQVLGCARSSVDFQEAYGQANINEEIRKAMPSGKLDYLSVPWKNQPGIW
jgi:hypothetical protein